MAIRSKIGITRQNSSVSYKTHRSCNEISFWVGELMRCVPEPMESRLK